MRVHACGQFCNRTFNSEYVAKILLKPITSIITTSFHWIDENSEMWIESKASFFEQKLQIM